MPALALFDFFLFFNSNKCAKMFPKIMNPMTCDVVKATCVYTMVLLLFVRSRAESELETLMSLDIPLAVVAVRSTRVLWLSFDRAAPKKRVLQSVYVYD